MPPMPRKKVEGPVGVRVRVLGATEITVGHRRVGMGTELLFALALYLTTRAGERVPRDEVLELFWPTGAEDDRRHALRLRWLDVAEQTGVAQSILSRLATISRQDDEGHAFRPSLENALALATWLKVPLEVFWDQTSTK